MLADVSNQDASSDANHAEFEEVDETQAQQNVQEDLENEQMLLKNIEIAKIMKCQEKMVNSRKEKFHIITCQFAYHYGESKYHLQNFMNNARSFKLVDI